MTKTNLLRVVAGVVLIFGLLLSCSPQAAYAKSYSKVANTPAVIQIDPLPHNSIPKPIVSVPNVWRDSGDPRVWTGIPRWIRDLGLCIRKHESIEQGHYKAHNGTSSAAGAYQMLDGTWRGNAKWTKVHGKFVARKYSAANHAPDWIQDAVFIHSIRHNGIHNWSGTHCGYGT